MPDFSTLSRRQKFLKVNIPYRGSDGPLHLLVDSTGVRCRAMEFTSSREGDSPVLLDLLVC